MNNGKTTFWKLISDNSLEKIEIPQIQRDYVQGRNTPKIKHARKVLLDDIYNAISNGKELDLNFVYGKTQEGLSDKKSDFIPIDGQQRLTLLLLLHIYAFSKDKKTTYLKTLKEKFVYHTRTTTERFLNMLIDNFSAFSFAQNETPENFINDAYWFSEVWNSDPSVASAKTVLNDIHERFYNASNLSDKVTAEDCPVTFMQLAIDELGEANKLYIKMNSRGKPLTEFESFKSSLFDFIEESVQAKTLKIPSDFKSLMDNEWLNTVWEICDLPIDERDPAGICDYLYINLLHSIILNRAVAAQDNGKVEQEQIEKLRENGGFFNFSNYRELLNSNILNDIYATFNFLEFAKQEKSTFAKLSNLIKPLHKTALSYDMSVLLFAVTRYAVACNKSRWSVEQFNRWFRIAKHLINNTEIILKFYQPALKSLCEIPDKVVCDPIQNFTSNIKVSFFTDRQVAEECLKCLLINKSAEWEPVLIGTDDLDYFEGEIDFALRLSGITAESVPNDQGVAIKSFKEVWQQVTRIFNAKGLCVNDMLFRRALLTFGNYALGASSSYTFFFEGRNEYYNWRRLLREHDAPCFECFKKFLEELKNYSDIDKMMQARIDNYTDKSDEFIYYVIKREGIFDYIKWENRYRESSGSEIFDELRVQKYHDKQDKRIILYSGSRLSAKYEEAHTFIPYLILKDKFVDGEIVSYPTSGYLNKQNSIVKMEIKGNSYYFVDCYYDGTDKPVLVNGQPITSIDVFLDYLRKQYAI